MSQVTIRPIKVLRVIARLNVGGPALHCLLLSKGLGRQGFDNLLVTGTLEPDEASFEDMFDVRPEGFRLIKLPRLRRSITGVGDLTTLWQLIQLMRRERPDIVHTHTAKAGVLGRIAAILTGVPVVVHTFHGHVLSGYFPNWFSRAIRLLERVLAFRTSAIVTLSIQLKRELSEKFRIAPASRFRIIPLGRDLDSFFSADSLRGQLRRELGITDPRAKLIGIIGRLVPIKDHSTLLKACAKLRLSVPFHLIIVGEGELTNQLKTEAVALGIAHSVHFLGWRSDLPRVYSDLDLTALSSKNEGTPLSIIESFAAGCPVVSTQVGGVADMFHFPDAPHGTIIYADEGALVPAGDSDALARAMTTILQDEQRRAACAKAARRTSEIYTETALTERISALYHELLTNLKGGYARD